MNYPFTALVGQEPLKTALCLLAVNPAIGGLLIRGEKGTAKSTAARALADLLPSLRMVVAGCPFNCDPDVPWSDCPHCAGLGERPVREGPVPFVDLPLGATEDRVLGSLDFERALREGSRSFQPGLLASAHRGILYIDEVNLLADHLVDVLLDASALGVNTVQREGMAVVHPARFLLIGTMNPEEGDLRPQLLDRFGLMVEVAGPREPEIRAEVVRRRLAYEADPKGFAATWEGEQEKLRNRLLAARNCLPTVTMADELLSQISRICCEFEVDGLRADIVMHKTAQGLAALEGRQAVTLEDVRAAAEWVLPHRRRRRPFEQPHLDREKLAELLAGTSPPSGGPPGERPPEKGSGSLDSDQNHNGSSGKQQPMEEMVFRPLVPQSVRRIEVAARQTAGVSHGRRNPKATREQGHYVRAVADPAPDNLALDATLRAAAQRGTNKEGRLDVQPGDLHRKIREGKSGTRILFVVDASGSMAARQRMELVKGAVVRLLEDAYACRDQVGVIAFRGPQAEVLLPFTGSVDQAEQALRRLPTGGRTPLAHALVLAAEMVAQARKAGPDSPILVVLISDGKANVPLADTASDPWEQALKAGQQLTQEKVPILILDTENGMVRSGRAGQLAEGLGVECLPLEGLSTEDLILKVRAPR